MSLLKERDRQYLKGEFGKLINPVKLVFFTQGLDCETCAPTKEILDELASLDDRIQVQTFNRVLDKEPAARFNIQRIPAIAVLRTETEEKDGEAQATERDYGIRFYGIPAGYEFASLIGDIMDVSRGDSGLSPASREALAGLTQPLHLQVFTTPG